MQGMRVVNLYIYHFFFTNLCNYLFICNLLYYHIYYEVFECFSNRYEIFLMGKVLDEFGSQ